MILIISPPANRFTLRRFGKINVLKKIISRNNLNKGSSNKNSLESL